MVKPRFHRQILFVVLNISFLHIECVVWMCVPARQHLPRNLTAYTKPCRLYMICDRKLDYTARYAHVVIEGHLMKYWLVKVYTLLNPKPTAFIDLVALQESSKLLVFPHSLADAVGKITTARSRYRLGCVGNRLS